MHANMDTVTEKTTTTSRGFTYRYYVSADAQSRSSDTVLLLLHGFPDSASYWKHMLPFLAEAHLPIIMPDLLGYGGTSKPRDPTLYAYHLMARDVLDIVDAEGFTHVVSLGHDHGSGLAQRLYNHFPSRVRALAMLNVAYRAPDKSAPFNLAAVNKATTAMFGYPIFAYWNFLTAPDAARLLRADLHRTWAMLHAGSFDAMKAAFGVPGAFRAYLTDATAAAPVLKAYAGPGDGGARAEWAAALRDEHAFEAPLCWYAALLQQVQSDSDLAVADEHVKINVPALFIGCDGDAPCRKEMIGVAKGAGLLPDLTVHTLEGVGHWPMFEQPQKTAELVVAFLKDKGLAR